MLKKIFLLSVTILFTFSCSKQENVNNIDNIESWVIIGDKVEQLWVWNNWHESIILIDWGFNN